MSKYCCFNCPQKGDREKELTDLCPNCNKPYNFPLVDVPQIITSDDGTTYKVSRPINRGFYAATYLCKKGKLGSFTLLKVTPRQAYEVLKKYDPEKTTAEQIFIDECNEHFNIAKDTEHIVKIIDYFNSNIHFGKISIDCFVAELEYIEGNTFDTFISEPQNISARNFAQLAVDLFKLWGELIRKERYHNDLHEGNLIVKILDDEVRRSEALNNSIKLIAIDLNSSNEESLSSGIREGDQRQILHHIKKMIDILKYKGIEIDDISDYNYRVIETLEKISNFIIPEADRGRTPDIDELIKIIKEDFHSNLSYEPWNKDFILTRLNDGYNAQTLHKCYLPLLIVDPNNSWMDKISISGPQLITGMRGCGKTTLLGTLDFHARASGEKRNEAKDEKVKRISEDHYIGISVSCSKLIDNQGEGTQYYFAKLIWLYTISLLGILRHLRNIEEAIISGSYLTEIKEMLESTLNIEIPERVLKSDYSFERYMNMKIDMFSTDTPEFNMAATPLQAFENFALLIKGITSLWQNKTVYYLLDDASTRYLSEDNIIKLFTNLLFQSDNCAFKITTELQTLELGLNSPGNVEIAREGRDYTVFDLGQEVNDMIKSKNNFLEKILQKRKNYYLKHPNREPKDILGSCSLKSIALNIVNTSKTSKERKAVYHGITALAHLCVGDIGDVITLYDMIIDKSKDGEYPVSPDVQSECYQVLCSRRLYNLDRRDSKYREYALSFAEASYHLLIKSKKDYDKLPDEVKNGKTFRERQYLNLYVRITSGNPTLQLKLIRELVDAGVFVFTTGSPRTKTRDTNPILYFKLIYRKLYGISNYIGLSDRDRFELSGEQLEKWLHNPCKEILIENLGAEESDLEEIDPDYENIIHDAHVDKAIKKVSKANRQKDSKKIQSKGEQLSLFLPQISYTNIDRESIYKVDKEYLYKRGAIQFIDSKNINTLDVETIIIALGFEERTLESAKKIFSTYLPRKVILISYPDAGKSSDIIDIINNNARSEQVTFDYEDIEGICNCLSNCDNILVDITGMTKPLIFLIVRQLLNNNKDIFISYTEAKEYYPLEIDIQNKFRETEKLEENYRFNKIMTDLMIGEIPPYTTTALLKNDYDSTRPTSLLGFVSSKNQRILTLLDKKDYSHIELFVPEGETKRNQLARMAADVVAVNYDSTYVSYASQKDLKSLFDKLMDKYYALYINQGTNIDLSLTGTKLQAVVSAVFSSVCRLSQCWYVKPNQFDSERFSKGFLETQFYQITKKLKCNCVTH